MAIDQQYKTIVNLTADIVWGAAVAVDRIYDGAYYKETVYEADVEIDELVELYQANKIIVRRWLAAGRLDRITEEDIVQGRALRHYFNGWVLKEISGDINEFESRVLKIAQNDKFTNRSLLDFAIISCLPSTHRRDIDRTNLHREIRESTPLVGDEGDHVSGELIVIKCNYNTDYEKYRVQGRFGESFVDFWFSYGEGVNADDVIAIKGRIKKHRDDGSTQLNYVRLK